MPRIKERSNRILLDREARIEKAIKAYRDNKFTSIGEAAIAFDLPKSTLGHRLQGRENRQKAHEDQQLFTPAAEKAIVQWILKLDDYGFPPRIDRLWSLVHVLANDKGQGGQDQIGKNWMTRFLNRHPVLTTKFAQRLDRQRHYANNPIIIADHFRKLGKVLKQHNIKPHAITNIDEKGIILGFSARTRVITRKGKKRPYVKQDGKREMVTALEAVSADGYVFPSFIISKGQTHTYGRFGNVTKEDSEVHFAKSPKGWIDEELAYHWLTHVYHPFSLKRINNGETRLLILDGHSSHVNARFLKFCEANDIICFCLPAHTTHLLQPLDVGLFGPFQRYYGMAVEDFFLGTNLGITHSSFLPLYKKACAQAVTRKNIESAFQACGIVPFNARVVVLPKVRLRGEDSEVVDREEFTQAEIRQQGIWRLEFVKTATPGEICDLVHTFNSREVYLQTKVQILEHELVRQKKELAQAQTKKDRRVLSKARVLTGQEALDLMATADAKRVAKGTKPRGRKPKKVIRTPSRPTSSGSSVAAVTAISAVSAIPTVSADPAISTGSVLPATPRRPQRLSRPLRVRFRTAEPSPLIRSPPSCIIDDDWSSDNDSIALEDLSSKMHGMQLRSKRN